MMIRPGIELANLTDVGCERTENEDYYCYAEPESDEEFRKKGRLAMVADGMGGHQGGQVASGLAVSVVCDTYLHDPTEPEAALLKAFESAHAAIQQYARDYPELRGMGTTCTAMALWDGRLCYAHVGDSRLYLLRDGRITRLTQDHTYVNRLLAQGAITPEEASVHPERNVLTAALGMDSAVPAEFPEAPIALQPGDTLLLSTDGLHGPVSDEELLVVAAQMPPRQACRTLVEMANARGGFDNITVQILRIQDVEIPSRRDSSGAGSEEGP